ncbi:MAG TPA: cupredoxin domain-containing protein [Thermodesulfobacteriota bacterium]|nr:cupredoxin domain-containing protein [Thermodesulfobacteriota bacterium]
MKNLILYLAALSIIFQAYTARAQQSAPAPPSDVQKVEVVVDSYSFTPDIIKVKAGKPVELTLRSVTSLIPHNFTIDDPASGLNVDADIPSGKDVTVTFTPLKTGKFQFYCGKKNILGSHLKKGMKGTLEVE